jgi:WhiB family redox-sensing transcriptional regulator
MSSVGLALLERATDPELELPCRRENSELWFADTPGDLDRAKAFCHECPLRKECLEGALSRREPWGVWGGEIFQRGQVIGAKRPRGRPRGSAGASLRLIG